MSSSQFRQKSLKGLSILAPQIMLAFHGTPSLKDMYLGVLRSHKATGRISRGRGMSAVAHTILSRKSVQEMDDFAYEQELGIPFVLARLENGILKGLPSDKFAAFPEAFIAAIRPGADLSQIWPQFAAWLLDDRIDGVIRFASRDRTDILLIDDIAQLYHDRCFDVDEWQAAERAASKNTEAAGRVAHWAALEGVRWVPRWREEETVRVQTERARRSALACIDAGVLHEDSGAREYADARGGESRAEGAKVRWQVEAERIEGAIRCGEDPACGAREASAAAACLHIGCEEIAYIKQAQKLLELLRAA